MSTPLPAPLATPAAQPPSLYRPTERDEKLVNIVEVTNRGIFVTSGTHSSLLLPDWPEKVH